LPSVSLVACFFSLEAKGSRRLPAGLRRAAEAPAMALLTRYVRFCVSPFGEKTANSSRAFLSAGLRQAGKPEGSFLQTAGVPRFL